MTRQSQPTRTRGSHNRVAPEEFFARARETHGSRYTYDESSYQGMKARVTGFCRAHGEFKKFAQDLLRGGGCQKCAFERRSAAQVVPYATFVERARATHGDRYEYPEGAYSGSAAKTSIICPNHGVFRQRPADHVGAEQGCPDPECSDPGAGRRVPFDEFVTRARSVHGDKYRYDEDSYSALSRATFIECPAHGAFSMNARVHVNQQEQGCRGCWDDRRGAALRMPFAQFLTRAREVHGDRYTYAADSYSGAAAKVSITCPQHGRFDQDASVHLSGSGCRACSYADRSEAQRLPFDAFVERVLAVHGDRYEFVEESWRGMSQKVTAVCPLHGEWSPVAWSLVQGSGCGECASSKGEAAIARVLHGAGVGFQRAWRDGTCRSTRPLPFDFAIPEQRTLIEFDGLQHRRPVKWTSSMTDEEARADFEGVQRRDRIKTDWATANGWRLIRLTNPKTIEPELIAHGVIPPMPFAAEKR